MRRPALASRQEVRRHRFLEPVVPVDVLLVEDLKNVQEVMTDLLTGLGDYRVVAAISTEAEALAWLDQHRGRWGLAVIDLVLDQGSGMEVIRRCRRSAPHARIVVFSSFVSPVIRAHCLRLGADAAYDKNTELAQFTAYCAAMPPAAAVHMP